MESFENPYLHMLERLRHLDQSIHVLNHVNNDLREILHKQKPLPKFILDSFKRTTISKSKTSPALPAPPAPPTESEEMRLAASMIDKAKRAIENITEKKSKPSSVTIPSTPAAAPSSIAHNSRPRSSLSVRPSSASSAGPASSDASTSQQLSVRRYVPAHMKAPFLTQPEKKRRPTSSTRRSTQTSLPTQRTSVPRRSISQQRRLFPSSTTQSTVELSQQTTGASSIPQVQNEVDPMIDNQAVNGTSDETTVLNHTPAVTTAQELEHVHDEAVEVETPTDSQPIILNRTLIKPLRRLWKQNQNLRLRLERELEKKSTSPPSFIDRLNEQIHSPSATDETVIPNTEVLLQLSMKLRAIVLYLLEASTFDDLEHALKRLNTLKYLVHQYSFFFTSNLNILITKYQYRPPKTIFNIQEILNNSNSPSISNSKIARYIDDGQLITFTEVRFKKFENECRWAELNWHEQMIMQFQKTLSKQNQNPLQIYRELMSLVTGLQTSTPIVVENRLE